VPSEPKQLADVVLPTEAFLKMPAVYRLSANILYYIFLVNTLSENDFLKFYDYFVIPATSLDTARKTSQVCTAWRHIMLSSSFIWANSLHTSYLLEKYRPWFEEVIERTGSAPLSIIHCERYHYQMGYSFFVSFLTDNWSRIRRIYLQIHSITEAEYSSILANFYRKSSQLEIFNHSGVGSVRPKFDPSHGLFAGVSPLLRQFSVLNVPFSLLPILTHITIIRLHACFIGKEFLLALAHMKSLESLVITDPHTSFQISDSDVISNKWSTIQLPALRYIQLDTIFKHFFWIMHAIDPCSKRLAQIDLEMRGDDIHIQSIWQLSKNVCLFTYAQHSKDNTPSISIFLTRV